MAAYSGRMSRLVRRVRIARVAAVALGTLPVCMGVAVLKYRLYELDRIISRVVSYTLITALLVGVYTARMRHTVDFDAVRDDLVGVVHEAFQPTQVSMWLVLADRQDVARLEQRLEVGQDPRPAL